MFKHQTAPVNVNVSVAQAIKIINEVLSNNPHHLEWLKTQALDEKLSLAVGEGGTPFIAIPANP